MFSIPLSAKKETVILKRHVTSPKPDYILNHTDDILNGVKPVDSWGSIMNWTLCKEKCRSPCRVVSVTVRVDLDRALSRIPVTTKNTANEIVPFTCPNENRKFKHGNLPTMTDIIETFFCRDTRRKWGIAWRMEKGSKITLAVGF